MQDHHPARPDRYTAPAAGRTGNTGDDLARVPVHQRVRGRLAMAPERRGVFPRLTLEEKLRTGPTSAPTGTASSPTSSRVSLLESPAVRAAYPGA
jgi:ABC-type branched-subunit amino acid transport system ATPase component